MLVTAIFSKKQVAARRQRPIRCKPPQSQRPRTKRPIRFKPPQSQRPRTNPPSSSSNYWSKHVPEGLPETFGPESFYCRSCGSTDPSVEWCYHCETTASVGSLTAECARSRSPLIKRLQDDGDDKILMGPKPENDGTTESPTSPGTELPEDDHVQHPKAERRATQVKHPHVEVQHQSDD